MRTSAECKGSCRKRIRGWRSTRLVNKFLDAEEACCGGRGRSLLKRSNADVQLSGQAACEGFGRQRRANPGRCPGRCDRGAQRELMDSRARDMPGRGTWICAVLVVFVASVASQPSAMDATIDNMGSDTGNGGSQWAASLDQSCSKLLLKTHISLRRFHVTHMVPVQWSALDQDAKLELLSKVSEPGSASPGPETH